MYFILYDRNFKTIGSSYILERWERTQRAVDFDSIRIVGEQIPYSAEPYFVVINDKQGRQIFSGLASTPMIDEEKKKTTINLKDYMTLFNTEAIFNFENQTINTVSDFLQRIKVVFSESGTTGIQGNNIIFETDELKDLQLDKDLFTLKKGSYQFYNLILGIINYYDLYCVTKLDVFKKSLTFTFKKSSIKRIELRLRDFGIYRIEKSFGQFNQVTIYNQDFIQKDKYYLSKNNNIISSTNVQGNYIYPIKNKNYISTDTELSKTLLQAVTDLAKNRYQENIDINAGQHRNVLDLKDIDFSYKIGIYTDEGFYKDLPVGEIETNSDGKFVIRLGYRVQELTQEI